MRVGWTRRGEGEKGRRGEREKGRKGEGEKGRKGRKGALLCVGFLFKFEDFKIEIRNPDSDSKSQIPNPKSQIPNPISQINSRISNRYTVTASLYSPQTFLRAWLISPTVTSLSTQVKIFGSKFSVPAAASLNSRRAASA